MFVEVSKNHEMVALNTKENQKRRMANQERINLVMRSILVKALISLLRSFSRIPVRKQTHIMLPFDNFSSEVHPIFLFILIIAFLSRLEPCEHKSIIKPVINIMINNYYKDTSGINVLAWIATRLFLKFEWSYKVTMKIAVLCRNFYFI